MTDLALFMGYFTMGAFTLMFHDAHWRSTLPNQNWPNFPPRSD
jgi:hypothetical protein